MGLLDFLQTDEGRLGLGLLAAAGPRADGMGAGGRIQEAFMGADARKRAKADDEWKKMQMDDARSQIDARKLAGIKDARQQAWIESLMGGGSSQGGAQGVSGQAGAQPGLLDLARQYGIPEKAIQADIAFNGGKKISELLAKHGAPDMQVTNGYAYDKNKVGPGYLPSLSISQDGKASMVQVGQDGMPVVSAPRGAMETFGGYQDAQAARKPIKVFNPATQREEYTNEGAVVGGNQPQGGVRQAPTELPSFGNSQPTPQQMALIRADIARNGNPNPTLNFNAQAPGNFAAGPSADEAMTQAATKEQAVAQAKDVAEQRKGIMNGGFNAGANIAKYQKLWKLLEGVDGGSLTATGTHIASTMNSLGFKIDSNLPNKEAAAALGNEMALELRNPASGAGMPGAMSDKDREFLVSMIPSANQSAAGRKMLITSAVAVEQRKQQVATFARNYEKKHGKIDNGFFDQMQAWSNANPLFGDK